MHSTHNGHRENKSATFVVAAATAAVLVSVGGAAVLPSSFAAAQYIAAQKAVKIQVPKLSPSGGTAFPIDDNRRVFTELFLQCAAIDGNPITIEEVTAGSGATLTLSTGSSTRTGLEFEANVPKRKRTAHEHMAPAAAPLCDGIANFRYCLTATLGGAASKPAAFDVKCVDNTKPSKANPGQFATRIQRIIIDPAVGLTRVPLTCPATTVAFEPYRPNALDASPFLAFRFDASAPTSEATIASLVRSFKIVDDEDATTGIFRHFLKTVFAPVKSAPSDENGFEGRGFVAQKAWEDDEDEDARSGAGAKAPKGKVSSGGGKSGKDDDDEEYKKLTGGGSKSSSGGRNSKDDGEDDGKKKSSSSSSGGSGGASKKSEDDDDEDDRKKSSGGGGIPPAKKGSSSKDDDDDDDKPARGGGGGGGSSSKAGAGGGKSYGLPDEDKEEEEWAKRAAIPEKKKKREDATEDSPKTTRATRATTTTTRPPRNTDKAGKKTSTTTTKAPRQTSAPVTSETTAPLRVDDDDDDDAVVATKPTTSSTKPSTTTTTTTRPPTQAAREVTDGDDDSKPITLSTAAAVAPPPPPNAGNVAENPAWSSSGFPNIFFCPSINDFAAVMTAVGIGSDPNGKYDTAIPPEAAKCSNPSLALLQDAHAVLKGFFVVRRSALGTTIAKHKLTFEAVGFKGGSCRGKVIFRIPDASATNIPRAPVADDINPVPATYDDPKIPSLFSRSTGSLLFIPAGGASLRISFSRTVGANQKAIMSPAAVDNVDVVAVADNTLAVRVVSGPSTCITAEVMKEPGMQHTVLVSTLPSYGPCSAVFSVRYGKDGERAYIPVTAVGFGRADPTPLGTSINSPTVESWKWFPAMFASLGNLMVADTTNTACGVADIYPKVQLRTAITDLLFPSTLSPSAGEMMVISPAAINSLFGSPANVTVESGACNLGLPVQQQQQGLPEPTKALVNVPILTLVQIRAEPDAAPQQCIVKVTPSVDAIRKPSLKPITFLYSALAGAEPTTTVLTTTAPTTIPTTTEPETTAAPTDGEGFERVGDEGAPLAESDWDYDEDEENEEWDGEGLAEDLVDPKQLAAKLKKSNKQKANNGGGASTADDLAYESSTSAKVFSGLLKLVFIAVPLCLAFYYRRDLKLLLERYRLHFSFIPLPGGGAVDSRASGGRTSSTRAAQRRRGTKSTAEERAAITADRGEEEASSGEDEARSVPMRMIKTSSTAVKGSKKSSTAAAVEIDFHANNHAADVASAPAPAKKKTIAKKKAGAASNPAPAATEGWDNEDDDDELLGGRPTAAKPSAAVKVSSVAKPSLVRGGSAAVSIPAEDATAATTVAAALKSVVRPKIVKKKD